MTGKIFRFGSGEKKQKKQRKPGDQSGPAKQQLSVPDPFPHFVYQDKKQENHHAHLEEKTDLVTCTMDAFDENVFIQCKHAQYNPFDGLVSKVKPEGPFFIRIQIPDYLFNTGKYKLSHYLQKYGERTAVVIYLVIFIKCIEQKKYVDV